MATSLSFETGPVQLSLRHSEGLEQAPVINVQLHAMGNAQIHTADGHSLHEARWAMTITSAHAPQPFTLRYAAAGERRLCTLFADQSPARFALLLDMFRDGNVFEITVDIEGLVALSDYSRKWDTRAAPMLIVSSLCFDIPLARGEG